MHRLSSPLEDLREHYDVVVVGSGYGGGVAASRLARAGRSVCLLERGLERHPGEYPDTFLDATRDIQIDTPEAHLWSHTAMFDFRINPDLNVLVGCGLGGTSLINANVSLPPDPRIFDDARWPAGAAGRSRRSACRCLFARDPDAATGDVSSKTRPPLNKLAAHEKSARGDATALSPCPYQRDIRGAHQSRRRRTTRVHALWRLRDGVQRGGEEHDADELPAGCLESWRADLRGIARAVLWLAQGDSGPCTSTPHTADGRSSKTR